MNECYGDEFWMLQALKLAEYAQFQGEISVGAVLLLNGKVIGQGWNCSINCHDPTAHAEIVALRQGGQQIENYRLLNTVMYVTLEPCVMCIGAMIHARIGRLVFGAYGKKNGSSRSTLDILNHSEFNHRIAITGGVLAQLCSFQLNNFFYVLRTHKISQNNGNRKY